MGSELQLNNIVDDSGKGMQALDDSRRGMWALDEKCQEKVSLRTTVKRRNSPCTTAGEEALLPGKTGKPVVT